MADENFSPAAERTMPAPRSGGGLRALVATALLAFLFGAGAVGYALWQGLVPLRLAKPEAVAVAPDGPARRVAVAPTMTTAGLAAQQDVLEGRVAALSQRLDSLDLQATGAARNASRAEALLVAFAARRMLDRGAPLGLLEDQLRLRFGDAQPHAVSAVINAAHDPVTLDQLAARLDAMAPELTATPATTGAWTRLKQEFAGLFVIRRESAPSPEPQVVLRRARVLLEEGRTDDAMAEVRRLPGASGAGPWLDSVKRYADARRALDVLETTALIEPRNLRDTRGNRIDSMPAPDAAPAAQPSGAAAAL